MEFVTNFMEAGVSTTLQSELPKKSFLAMNCYFVKKKSKNLALNYYFFLYIHKSFL